MFQISNAEADSIDKLIDVHSQDGYVTLKDDVNQGRKCEALLSLRLISFVIWFPQP